MGVATGPLGNEEAVAEGVRRAGLSWGSNREPQSVEVSIEPVTGEAMTIPGSWVQAK